MARKVSDLVLLLGSRGPGRGRSRSGVLSQLSNGVIRLFGGRPGGRRGSQGRNSGGRGRGISALLPGWIVLAVAFACFGGGYLIGDRFGSGQHPAGPRPEAGLKTSGPQVPGVIADTQPLSSWAFFVAAYEGMSADAARTRAIQLTEYLHGKGLAKARPYELAAQDRMVWCVVVYYGNDQEWSDFMAQLRALPEDVPDPVFVAMRKQETDWPSAWQIK